MKDEEIDHFILHPSGLILLLAIVAAQAALVLPSGIGDE